MPYSSSPPEDSDFWMQYSYGSLRSQKQFRITTDAPLMTSESPPASPTSLLVAADGTLPNLRELLTVLQTANGLKMLKTAFRNNMQYKVEKYTELMNTAEVEVRKHKEVMAIKVPELKRLANVKDDNDNWVIFESVNEAYKEAKTRSAAFEAIRERARDKLSGTMAIEDVRSHDTVKDVRDDLVRNLKVLTNFTSSQPHVIKKVVDIVGSFIKDPTIFRKKLMNFMLVGGAGTGKTSLAKVIGSVFASAGMFVSGSVIEAGRAELVGQYEGQTVARTQNFLTSNLDNGVIFVDEAYAITPWDKGKPEGYGSEAATAMVEFMTKYPGLYCIIVAGYEKQMVRYFLGSNEGLPRRFPNKFVLRDFSADELITVFKRKLLEIQDVPVPDGKGVRLESDDYFTPEAWQYLRSLLTESVQGESYQTEEYDDSTKRTYKNVKTFVPRYDLMYSLFENQAGSMTLLADEAITLLYTTISYEDVFAMQKKAGSNVRPVIKMQSVGVMRDIVAQRIGTMALSLSDEYMVQWQEVERRIEM